MKVSELIEKLQEAQGQAGDVNVSGAAVGGITVEVYPADENGAGFVYLA
jgi:hypothetical protein